MELALANGYPIDLRYKLLERRAKCLLALGRPIREIATACEGALDAARQSVKLDAAKRGQFERDIGKLLDEARNADNSTPNPSKGEQRLSK